MLCFKDAEWVVESDQGGEIEDTEEVSTLLNFGSVTFTAAAATTVNGNIFLPSDNAVPPLTLLQMGDDLDDPDASAALVGNNIVITYQH